MPRISRLLWLLLLATPLPGRLFSAESTSTNSWEEELRSFLQQPRFAAASWGIKVVEARNGRVLFDHQSARLHKPASNAKLFTAALVLDRFGPDFTIETTLSASKPVSSSGKINGPLRVYGRGDPSFAARFFQGDYSQSLKRFGEALRRAGVKKIEGGLVGDLSYFTGPPFGSGWTWDDLQYYYGAEVSELTAEDNVVDLIFSAASRPGEPALIEAKPAGRYLTFDNRTRTAESGPEIDATRLPGERSVLLTGTIAPGKKQTNAITVPNPGLFFLELLRDQLQQSGISVSGKNSLVSEADRPTNSFERWVDVATVRSPPLSRLVEVMMKPSQNLHAQLLFLQAGARSAETNSRRNTEDRALAELRQFLTRQKIAPTEVLLEEGSGLSRGALVTPHAIVSLLLAMDRHPHREAFLASLPIAGVDGTLRRRFRGTRAEGNLRAKTGTLRYVNCLSGFVTNAGGERLAFSIMSNNYLPPEGRTGREEVDAVARIIAEGK